MAETATMIADSASPWAHNWVQQARRSAQTASGFGLLFAGILQLTALGMPLYFQLVIDKVLVHGAVATLSALFIGFLLLLLFEALFSGVRQAFDRRIFAMLDKQLNSGLLAGIVHHPSAAAAVDSGSRLFAQFKRVDQIRAFLLGPARSFKLDLIFLVPLLALMALFSPLLTGVILVLAIGYGVLTGLVTYFQTPADGEVLSAASASLAECLGGAAVARQLGAGSKLLSAWSGSADAQATLGSQAAARAQGVQQFAQLFGKFLMALVLFLGAQQVMGGQMTVGQLIAFNLLLGQLLPLISRFAAYPSARRAYRSTLDALNGLVAPDVNPNVQPTPQPQEVQGQLTLRSVTTDHLTTPISLQLVPGTLTEISGKDAFAQAELGQLIGRGRQPVDGQVLLDDRPAETFNPEAYPLEVRLLRSTPVFLSGTIMENLSFGLRTRNSEDGDQLADARLRRACQLVGVDAKIHHLPQGYDTPIGPGGIELPAGMAQRLALARALASNPKVLVLDNALNALSPAAEVEVLSRLKRAAQFHSLLSLTTRPSSATAQLSDQRCHLSRQGLTRLGQSTSSTTPSTTANMEIAA